MCVGSGIRKLISLSSHFPRPEMAWVLSRHNLWLYFNPAGILKSFKLQASSLTTGPGDDRMNLERKNYETKSKF